jgi:hypothetical protein
MIRCLLPLLGSVALLAGCGDSGPLGAKELVARGDRICGQGQQRFAEIQSTPPANAADAADQTGALIEVSRQELAQLRDLEPPAELVGPMELYLQARQRALELLERGRSAAESRDRDRYAAAQASSRRIAPKRAELARRVGFRVCGQERP